MHFRFITWSSHFLATTYLAHLLAMIDAFAINCIGDEAALLCQLHIIKTNVFSIYYLDTLLHAETEIDSNISSQDEYGKNEGSLSSDESNSSPVSKFFGNCKVFIFLLLQFMDRYLISNG